MEDLSQKKIGLALGGGAVLGAAHVGVIRSIEECEVPVKYISGTSIGAMVAAMYAFGMHWEKMEEIARELNWLDISGLTLSNFALLSNKKIGQVISDHLGGVEFKDAEIPLAIVTTDIATGEKVVIDEGNVADAVMASTSIPGLFVPIEKDGRLLVDGGILENVPILSLNEMGADYIIGIDLHAEQTVEKPRNIVEVLINTIQLTRRNATRFQTKKADLLITPNLNRFNHYNVSQVPDLIKIGYEESRKEIRKVFPK